ncbi:MAG: hypothetical protein ACKOXB_13320 [Flavobacteriales bacterium]
MNTKAFYIVLASLSCLKIALSFFLPSIQTWEDYLIAENILESGNFYYENDGAINHSFQFPVYPILLSIALAMNHSAVSGIILNILLAAVACLFFRSNLQKLLFKGWIPLSMKKIHLLCLLPLLHPAFLYYELMHVHPFIHDFLMLNIGIGALLYLMDKGSRHPVEGGIMIGLAVLGRGTFIIFPALIIVILIYQKAFKKLGYALLGMTIMVSPWLMHNYLSDGILGLTSTNGKILWKGSLHNSEGGNYLLNGKNYYSALTQDDFRTLQYSSVKEQNEFFLSKYKKTLSNEPEHVFRLFAIKLKNFWFLPERISEDNGDQLKNPWLLYRIFNFVLVILLLIALIKYLKLKLLMLPFIMLSLLQCWFYFESRHRLLIDPWLIALLIASYVYYTAKKSENAK